MSVLTGYVDAQIFVPGISKCDPSIQWQVPWFTGTAGVGGGVCPVTRLELRRGGAWIGDNRGRDWARVVVERE